MNQFFSLFCTINTKLDAAMMRIFGSKAAAALLEAERITIKTELGAFALKVVQDLAGQNLTSKAVWELAAAKISAQAIAMGIDLAEEQLNLILALVTNATKRAQGATPTSLPKAN